MPETSLLIKNSQSPGDYVVLSAAIRDIQQQFPGRFKIRVEVAAPAVFQHNPYCDQTLKNVNKTLVAKYPLIQKSNQERAHFMWGYIEYMNAQLGLHATLGEFRPDLHLTAEEKATGLPGINKPYWVFASGGKRDYTAKWWDPAWWQVVVDRMRDHTVVQVGGGSHVHPPVKNCVDLVGKTSFRELMRLIYHSEGVLCIVTCLMHIAAAFNKPCVVVAGGREPWWWEGYTKENIVQNMRRGRPNWTLPAVDNYVYHQYLHTIGQLSCCEKGGCWKSRVEGGGSLCTKLVQQNGKTIPLCMQMITPDTVLAAVESYYQSGVLSRGTRRELVIPPAAVPVAPAAPAPEPIVKEEPVLLEPIQLRSAASSAAPVLEGSPRPDIYDVFIHDRIYAEKVTPTLSCSRVVVFDADFGRIMSMRSALSLSSGDYFVWVDSAYVRWMKDGWLEKVVERVGSEKAAGLVYRDRLPADAVARFQKAYDRARPLEKHPFDPAVFRVHYPQRGVIVMPGHLAKRVFLPAGFLDNELDLFLGVSLHQNEIPLVDIGDLVKCV